MSAVAIAPTVLIVASGLTSSVSGFRDQEGGAVLYSKHSGFLALFNALGRLFATGELTRLRSAGVITRHSTTRRRQDNDPESWLSQDLPSVGTVYVFVEGVEVMSSVRSFIVKLQDLGKTVLLVTCEDRDWPKKVELAQSLSLEIVPCECGGEQTCNYLLQNGTPPQVLPLAELMR